MASGGEDLWRECASWLTRCNLLHAEHKANRPESTISDLAYTLRDGVLLCNLLNVLDPGCIDLKDINQRTQMAQFLCMRNIRVFLRACHEHFELRDVELFDPSMLFDMSNFHRVLCTIAKLSQCPKAASLHVKPFSAHRTLSEEDIYKDLQALFLSDIPSPYTNPVKAVDIVKHSGGTPTPTEPSWVQFRIPSVIPSEERVEEIYEDLCYVTFSTEAGQPHSLEKRDYVIRELVDTECNYVDVLGKIHKHFVRPLSKYMKPQDMQVIFFGIKELHDIHSGFLRQLRLATEAGAPGAPPPPAPPAPAPPKLADVFLSWRERLLLYGDYCSNLTQAQDTLKTLFSKDDALNKQLQKCQKEHSDGRIQLRDILSVPMQRILKYHLLLDKLVQETQQNHEDFRGLERAKEAMVDVAQYINEVKRDSEVLTLLKNVKDSILDWELPEGTQLQDYGRLLLDGELRVKAHGDQKIRTRYIFVLDKVMLMCKPVKPEEYQERPRWKSVVEVLCPSLMLVGPRCNQPTTTKLSISDNQYSFRSLLRLSEYRVEDASARRTLRGDARWASHWYLVQRSKDSAFTLYARTDDVKRKWIKAIREAIDNMEPAGLRSTDHKFILHTFDKPATCDHCSKFLKGRIFQGYLCSVCAAHVHKTCIALSGRCGSAPAPPPPPPPAHVPSHAAQAPDNCLHYYMWYVGEMGRETATTRLERRADGTFLLRVRPLPPSGPNDTQYALSLKTDNTVKHMRVCRKPIDLVQHYFLSESRFFRSVVELVSYYERTSLGENFVGLNVILRWPFRRVVATAIHDFRPMDATQLGLRPGAKVLLLSKEGDARGWWKGRTLDRGDNRTGYFPKDCVREDPECIGTLD